MARLHDKQIFIDIIKEPEHFVQSRVYIGQSIRGQSNERHGNWFIFVNFPIRCNKLFDKRTRDLVFGQVNGVAVKFAAVNRMYVRREMIVSSSIYYAVWIEIWQWRMDGCMVFLAHARTQCKWVLCILLWATWWQVLWREYRPMKHYK